MSDRLVLISADGHVGPSIEGYRPYVESERLDDFDRFVDARRQWRKERNRSIGFAEDGELIHALFGDEMIKSYTGQEAIRRGGLRGVHDSDVRNAELEREGIVAEVLFPDFQNDNEPPWCAASPGPRTTPELRRAGALVYNRWLADFCSLLPGRRAGVALLQPFDIDDAVRDVHRARNAGLSSVMPPTGSLDLPSYHDTRYDPLWAACVDTGLPVTIHSGGTPWAGFGSYAMWVTKFEFMWWARRPLWEMILGGVFERFPELRVVFTEQGADWIPNLLETLDEQYHSPFERDIKEKLSLSPSEYWGRNCYVGTSFMSRAECDLRDRIGVGRMLWGADYPHIEGTWPHSLEAIREACNGCTATEIRLMTSSNAAGVYGFDLVALQPHADRVGPTINSLLSLPAPAPARYPEVAYALGKVSGRELGRRLMSKMATG